MKPQCLYCPNCGRRIPESDLEWADSGDSSYATIDCPECNIRIDMESKESDFQGSLLVEFK